MGVAVTVTYLGTLSAPSSTTVPAGGVPHIGTSEAEGIGGEEDTELVAPPTTS